jgi:hypothetical protein
MWRVAFFFIRDQICSIFLCVCSLSPLPVLCEITLTETSELTSKKPSNE